jgi:hypothetical protein
VRLLSIVSLASIAVGCNGVIDDPRGTERVDPMRPNPYIPGVGCERVDVPAVPLRHLTRAQYNNTVRDLLGATGAPASAFPPDDSTEGLEAGLNVSPLLVEDYFETAQDLATAAIADRASLLPCDPEVMGEDACASAFIAEFGRRAFRRPLTSAETDRLGALYAAGATEYDFATGIEMVVHAALTSPQFLYHDEIAPEGARAGDVVPVVGYAMASRLSYFLWNSMPDDALLDAAGAGELDTAEGVATHARRMLEDERTREGIQNFYRQWLDLDRIAGLEKDPAFYPEFNAAVASSMRASLDAYFDHVLFEGDGTVRSLFTDETVFANADLAPILEVEATGSELAPFTGVEGRHGLLAQPGLMALLGKGNQSDPIHRGVFVRTELLCQYLPPPPPGLIVVPPDPAPGISTRARFAEHTANDACSTCHQLIDPVGFGFENYDGIGRYRVEDEGNVVDASGELIQTRDANGPFDGAAALSDRLAGSAEVEECVTRKLFRYAVGRTELDSESCQLEEVFDLAESASFSIPEILVLLTQTDTFLHRRVEEVSP